MGIEPLITIAGISGVIYFLHRIQREIGGLRADVHTLVKGQDDHEVRIRTLEERS